MKVLLKIVKNLSKHSWMTMIISDDNMKHHQNVACSFLSIFPENSMKIS